jgi:hypothetical protein
VESDRDFVINRREFLEVAAVAALPAIAAAAQRDVRPRDSAALSVSHSVLIDTRYAAAHIVGARLAANGTNVLVIPEGDITQVWLDHVGPAWRDHPSTLAGLTARPALFCLEQFALTCGLRVVFHAEHVVHSAGRTEHSLLRGAVAAGLSKHDLDLAGPFWPARIAQVLAAPPARAVGERFGPSDAALSPTLAPGAQLLTSWIIARA